MTLGFVTLVVSEYVYLLNSIEDFHPIFIPHANNDVSHLIISIKQKKSNLEEATNNETARCTRIYVQV